MATHTRQHGTEVTEPADGLERINAIRRVLERGQYAKIDGCMMDLFSASAIVAVYDALNTTNQARYRQMLAPQMAKLAFKLAK